MRRHARYTLSRTLLDVSTPAPDPGETTEESTETERVEDSLKKLLKRAKGEVDKLRDQKRTEGPTEQDDEWQEDEAW
jgi:hypothetical protein